MPITEILAKNARLYPDDVSLVEINPELQEKRQVTWKEFELIETNPKEHYRKEIT
jgi:long-chain acyl-CoA synthetase